MEWIPLCLTQLFWNRMRRRILTSPGNRDVYFSFQYQEILYEKYNPMKRWKYLAIQKRKRSFPLNKFLLNFFVKKYFYCFRIIHAISLPDSGRIRSPFAVYWRRTIAGMVGRQRWRRVILAEAVMGVGFDWFL